MTKRKTYEEEYTQAALAGKPCLMCVGTGWIFPMRKDGQPDMRYATPQDPCPDCKGTGAR